MAIVQGNQNKLIISSDYLAIVLENQCDLGASFIVPNFLDQYMQGILQGCGRMLETSIAFETLQ